MGKNGGEGEIRTLEARKGLPVFKTGAFNRSATSPQFGMRFTVQITQADHRWQPF